MRDQRSGPGSASLRRAEDPWSGFEDTLTGLLRRSDAVGAMEFSAPTESARSQGRAAQSRCLVQLAADGSAWVTLRPAGRPIAEEMVSRTAPTDPARLARAVVETCRDSLGVPHPQLLTLRCEGAVGLHTGPLRLIRSDSLPIGGDPADHPDPVDVAVEVEDHEDARERYEALVERVTGRPCVVDDDGNLVFDHVGHRMHIEFTEDEPYARIWACVVHSVRSRSGAAFELTRLNLEDDRTTWLLRGRHVLQRTTVPVSPFLPRHAQAALEHFLYTFACTHDSITEKLGSRHV